MMLARLIMNISKDVVAPTNTRLVKPAAKRREQSIYSPSKRSKISREESPPKSGIFSGLTIHFYPNVAINPTRKKREESACQQGAVLAPKLTKDVTHVVVDEGVKAASLRKMSLLSEERAVIVKDKWLKDSLASGHLKPPINEYSIDGLHLDRQIQNEHETSAKAKSDKHTRIDISSLQVESSVESSSGTDFEHFVRAAKKTLGKTDEEQPSPDASDKERSPKPKRKTRADLWEAGLPCMEEHTGEHQNENPNSNTIGILEQMKDHYQRTGDPWRTKSYREAIAVLRKQKDYIQTAEQAIKLKGIGPNISQKIEEIAQTGHLQKLESLDSSDKTRELFLGVYRCGIKTAEKWIHAGCRSLEDVKKWGNPSPAQVIGIDLYDDLHTPVPRSEVEEHYEIVKEAAQNADPGLIVHPMGSYRRGADLCGDIDIIITKQDAEMSKLSASLPEILENLYQKQFILRGPAEVGGSAENRSWQGISRLPKPRALHRRLDILLVPWKERGAAFIYYTGNDIFNRSIRLLAHKKGYKLSDKGLFKIAQVGEAREDIPIGSLVVSENEEDIFRFLGVPFKPPELRNC